MTSVSSISLRDTMKSWRGNLEHYTLNIFNILDSRVAPQNHTIPPLLRMTSKELSLRGVGGDAAVWATKQSRPRFNN
jgi:hypothetical protein